MFNSLFHTIGSSMKGKRRSLMGLGLLAIVGIVAIMTLGPASVQGESGIVPAKLWINDNFLSGQALFSDYATYPDSGGWYIDHRLTLTDYDLCVTAWVRGSLFFIYMDYNPDVGGFDCSPARTYKIVPLASCGITDPKSFRIRAENLFSRKNSTTVEFAFVVCIDGKAISYEVRPDTEVPITVVDSKTRELTYSGTAKLWRLTPAFKREKVPVAVCTFSSFPFDITVTLGL